MGIMEILIACAGFAVFGFIAGILYADLWNANADDDEIMEPYGYGMNKYRKVRR